jgi:hypothetical protein
MTDLGKRKPILCLDFDGVCHLYTSGWKGAAVIPDGPVEGLFEFLANAGQHFEIDIFSSRTHQDGGLVAMRNWFRDQYVRWHLTKFPGDTKRIAEDQATVLIRDVWQFPKEKPPAFVALDDRVLTFTGTWPSVESLRDFKPWNTKGV